MTKLIPIDDIIAGTNVRKEHDDEISELATSIERIGLQNALVVVKTESGKYRIISGHRRFLACKRLGLQDVECKIVYAEAEEQLEMQLAENVQRKNMSAYENVLIIKKLREERGFTNQQIATIFGKSTGWIATQITAVNALERQYGDPDLIPEEKKHASAPTLLAERKKRMCNNDTVIDCKGFSARYHGHSYILNFQDFEQEQKLREFIAQNKVN